MMRLRAIAAAAARRRAGGGGGGGKTFTFGRTTASFSGATNLPAVTFGASTPAGALVYAVLTQTFGANSPKSITNVRDNVDTGEDYTLLHETNNSGNIYVHVYGKVATAAGTRTVTGTLAGTADCTLDACEWGSSGGFVFGNVASRSRRCTTRATPTSDRSAGAGKPAPTTRSSSTLR